MNGVYWCVIHKMYFWYFMYSDYSCQQRDKFIYENMFFLNLYNSHFAFLEKHFYCYEYRLKAGLHDEIFLSRPWNFVFERKVSKYFRKCVSKCESWNVIQFVYTIKFHSYNHDNVSFVERINIFHFSCLR